MKFYGILSCICISSLVDVRMCLILKARQSVSHTKEEHGQRVCNVICTVGALHFGSDEDS